MYLSRLITTVSLLVSPALADVWVSTQPMVTDCSPWGDASKQTTNSNGSSLFLTSTVASEPPNTNWRRPIIAIDIGRTDEGDQFPGDVDDIVSVSLWLNVTVASTSGADMVIYQVNPQCSHVSPSSTDAAEFDEAEGDWLEKAGGGTVHNWLTPGVDVFVANPYYPGGVPTSTGWWEITDGWLTDVVTDAAADHDSWVFLRLSWLSEATSTETVRFAADDTVDYAYLEITYVTGIVIHRRRMEGHVEVNDEPVWVDRPRGVTIRRAA